MIKSSKIKKEIDDYRCKQNTNKRSKKRKNVDNHLPILTKVSLCVYEKKRKKKFTGKQENMPPLSHSLIFGSRANEWERKSIKNAFTLLLTFFLFLPV